MGRSIIKNILLYIVSIVSTLLISSSIFYFNDFMFGPIAMTRIMPHNPFLYILTTGDLHQYYWWHHTIAAILIIYIFKALICNEKLEIIYGGTIATFYASLALMDATKFESIIWGETIGNIIICLAVLYSLFAERR